MGKRIMTESEWIEMLENASDVRTRSYDKDMKTIIEIMNHIPKLCKLAIEQYSWAFQHIRKQTPELCKFAVENNPWLIKFVRNQTPELCKIAVESNCWNLEYIRNPTKELYISAIKQDKRIIIIINKIKFPEVYEYWRLLYG